MTNVPGLGFAVILLGGFSSLVLFASVVAALAISHLTEKHDFIWILAGSYLGIGALSGGMIIVSHFSGVISLVSTLVMGAIAYLVSGLVAAFPLLIGAAIIRWRDENVSWNEGIEYSSNGWLIGAAVPAIGALATNFIVALLIPVTAFFGAVVGGPLIAELSRK